MRQLRHIHAGAASMWSSGTTACTPILERNPGHVATFPSFTFTGSHRAQTQRCWHLLLIGSTLCWWAEAGVCVLLLSCCQLRLDHAQPRRHVEQL